MFLTRFPINPRRRGAAKLLSSPHAMHAAVLAGFPEPESGSERGRILWRLDSGGPRAVLYISSPDQPDLEHLNEQAGWPSLISWESRPYSQFLAQLATGQEWAFRLTANPVRNVRVQAGQRGKPLGHVTPSQQLGWLLERENAAGFAVMRNAGGEASVGVTRRETLNFRRGTAAVTLRIATFDGILTVSDRERFIHTLTHGLGRAKGYGCGLLTVAPVR
ncbi:type I-E CRISPR-associated protein Cas6/Cse3/CasE [Luethyella okanaganae]|uniref:Type I-E CRISPR-associated protein Cas6/Cse3/CasE n=1 Tax=Luethyella okanaganae TaxID=69372 RepID=A0ABW1VDQ5_9MICO